MSSANSITNYNLHPTRHLTERSPEWEIHFGMTGILYVVGPGPRAMQRVARIPNETFIQVARDTVIHLNQTRREDCDAGAREIREALLLCGWDEEIV
jgi:hypothetical protein